MLRLEGVSIFRHLVCNGGMGHTDYYDHREVHRDGSILSFRWPAVAGSQRFGNLRFIDNA